MVVSIITSEGEVRVEAEAIRKSVIGSSDAWIIVNPSPEAEASGLLDRRLEWAVLVEGPLVARVAPARLTLERVGETGALILSG